MTASFVGGPWNGKEFKIKRLHRMLSVPYVVDDETKLVRTPGEIPRGEVRAALYELQLVRGYRLWYKFRNIY